MTAAAFSPLCAIYVVLGLLSNVWSHVHRQRTGHGLTPVDPRAGMGAVLAYAGATALHGQGFALGTWLLAALLPLIAYAGVYRHLRRPPGLGAQAYASAASRWSAIAINTLGVGAGLLALAR